MRHAPGWHKVPGQIRLVREQRRGSFTGEFPEVPNEMGLIVIAALKRGIGPTGLLAFHGWKNTLESFNAREELGWDADRGGESPLELPRAEAGLGRHLPDAPQFGRLELAQGQ
jgi:hypothetical protein